MRLFLSAILAMAWLIADALPGLAQTSAYTTAGVNMREGPGTNYRVIVVVPEGASVVINDCLNERRWCDVSWQSYRGFVYDRYLSTYSDGYAPEYNLPRTAPPAVIFEYYNYGDRDYRPYYRYRYRDRYDRRRDLHRDRNKRRKYDRRRGKRKYDGSNDRKRRDLRKYRKKRDGKKLDRKRRRPSSENRMKRKRSENRRLKRKRSERRKTKRSRKGSSGTRKKDIKRQRTP